jgi:tRNA(adenine34) deaminase
MHAGYVQPVNAEEADLDSRWMRAALEEADAASSVGEVPVGCVLVSAEGAVLARGHNEREMLNDPTAHAEMIAIRAAAQKLGSWRLDGVIAYVTLEPCAMCAGALVHARVGRVVYGCGDPKAGAVTSLFTIGQDARLNHRFEVRSGVLAEESTSRLRTFFAHLRAQGKK